jgi:hypothetical protein
MKSFITVTELEKKCLSHGDTVKVSYSCSFSGKENILGFEVIVDDLYHKDTVFRTKWICVNTNIGKDRSIKIDYKQVVVKFPARFRYRPDLLNNAGYSVFSKVKVRAWMMDKIEYNRLKKNLLHRQAYEKAGVLRSQLFSRLHDPFSRPSKSSEVCMKFFDEIRFNSELKTIYQCPYEDGIHIHKKITDNIFHNVHPNFEKKM